MTKDNNLSLKRLEAAFNEDTIDIEVFKQAVK